LLAYEGLYFASVALETTTPAELEAYRSSLRRMAGPGSDLYSGMGQGPKMDLLVKKRAEVFRMYGLDPTGVEQIAGLGVCAMCGLKLKSECQSSVVVFTDGKPRVFFLTGQVKGSASHDIVCHTSTPVLVTGKVVRPSRVEADGGLVVGELQPTRFVADRRPEAGQGKEQTIAGEGKCGKCDLNSGKECQNVIVAKVNGKECFYYLINNETSSAIHMSGQTYVVSGEFQVPPRAAPGGVVGLVNASKIAVVRAGGR
jgi:hypothetical protein